MDTKHTPGPWQFEALGNRIVVCTESAKKSRYGASRYAAIGGFDRNDPDQLGEAMANARLIAAAPDLLAVAFDYLEVLGEIDGPCECGEPECRTTRLRAAIAKATGSQS